MDRYQGSGKGTSMPAYGGPSRAVITGAAGFIGRHLAVALETRGVDVTGVDNMSVEQLQPYPGSHLLIKDVHDLTIDELAGVDTVIHLASAKNVPKSFGQPQFYASNASMTIHLLDLAYRLGIPRVLIGSTCEVYGDQGNEPLTELLPVAPRSPYAASKAAMEMSVRVYQLAKKQTTHDVTVARIFNVYGPGERADALIPSFCHSALKYQRLPVEGSGRQRRDFTYIDDAVDDLIDSLYSTADIVNLGSGSTASVLEIAELVGANIDGVVIEHYPARPNEIPSFMSNRRLEPEDGAVANKDRSVRTSLADGIAKTIGWWRQQIIDNPEFGDCDSILVEKYAASERI